MPEVRIDGLRETVAALRALPKELASKNGGPVRRSLFKAAKLILEDVRRRAPVLTGNLRANIYVYRDRNPQSSGAAERYFIGVRTKRRRYGDTRLNRRLGRVSRHYRIRGDAYYWFMLEFGTERMSAHPFLRPAFESNKSAAVDIFANELRAGVAEAVRKARQAK